MIANGNTVYWTDRGSGDIRRVLPGNTPELVVGGRGPMRDLAVDAGVVYWLEDYSDGGPSTVFQLVSGGVVPQPLSGPSSPIVGEVGIADLAATPSSLTLTADGLDWSDDTNGFFWQRGWRSFDQPLGWSDGQPAPWQVTSAVADGYGQIIFWTDARAHAIRAHGVDCDLTSGETNPGWIATGPGPMPPFDGAFYSGFHVFWIESGRVRRLTTTNTHVWGAWCNP